MNQRMFIGCGFAFVGLSAVCIAQVVPDPIPVVQCPGRYIQSGLSLQQYWIPAFECYEEGERCVYTIVEDENGNETGVGFCQVMA